MSEKNRLFARYFIANFNNPVVPIPMRSKLVPKSDRQIRVSR